MAERILRSYGLEALLDDPRFATNEARVKHAVELDGFVRDAIGGRTLVENLAIIDRDRLTAGPVQTIAAIERDDHWRERMLTIDVAAPGQAIRMHNVCPRLSGSPGDVRHAGGELGQDNAAVFGELGLKADDLERLRRLGVI
jgi:crotonobetainyl-CoA:carnitine CoA-transferase CaiB-like acyl-CoA transferase